MTTSKDIDLVNITQKKWADMVLKIGSAYRKNNNLDDLISELLHKIYAFDHCSILFKPTLSGGAQTFRSNLDGALSYFVGNNSKYPMDNGFGIKSWHKFDSKTSDTFIEDNIAIWMGSVTLTSKNGDILKVDKSLAYKKLSNGNLKIVLHHSSLPYKSN